MKTRIPKHISYLQKAIFNIKKIKYYKTLTPDLFFTPIENHGNQCIHHINTSKKLAS